MKKRKSTDAWGDVKKSMTTPKKADWMTKEKKSLSKVKPIKKK